MEKLNKWLLVALFGVGMAIKTLIEEYNELLCDIEKLNELDFNVKDKKE